MNYAALGLSVLLTLAPAAGGAWAAEAEDAAPVSAASQPASEVVDDREASFMRPPAALLPIPDGAKPVEKAEEAKPAPIASALAASSVSPVSSTVASAQASGSNVNKAPSGAASLTTPPAAGLPSGPPPAGPQGQKPAPAPARAAAVPPVQGNVAAVPAVQSPEPTPVPAPAPAPAAPAPSEPVLLSQPVATAPLADIDPETMGLLSPANGGLGASLWKDSSRTLVDRLMPTIGLPTASATLNELARRAFLTTAAAPYVSEKSAKPVRSLLAQRIEALMALGSVGDAWKMASLADPKLVDPVTLRLLTEAALIGPDSKEICDKIPAMMAAHATTAEAGSEWQKSLLVCQLRSGDTKAVQLGVDLMREQPTRDDVFLSLINKNVLGGGKQLPRQMTPLRPLNLALLRQLTLPLPSELYARAEASMIPELLQTKAVDEKARIGLAEKAAGRGILSSIQLAAAYKSLSFTPQEIEGAFESLGVSPLTRAMAYQAALNEQAAAKKIALIQKVVAGLEDSALTGAQGDLVASLLDTVPVSAEQSAFAVRAARLYVLAGRPDKAALWLAQAHTSAASSPELAAQLIRNWPLFVLSGLVPDGDYAQGFKAWFASVSPSEGDDGNAQHLKRENSGKSLMVLNAAGFAVPEDAWIAIIEGVPPVKQMMPSPVLLERLKQAALAGRKGEVILLSLLTVGSTEGESSFGLLVEVVRALRLVGLQAESQALARELLVGLGLV